MARPQCDIYPLNFTEISFRNVFWEHILHINHTKTGGNLFVEQAL
jgi:hypothetical protein